MIWEAIFINNKLEDPDHCRFELYICILFKSGGVSRKFLQSFTADDFKTRGLAKLT